MRPLGGDGPFDATQAYATGVRRAAAGVPLPAVMDAYRVGSRFIWNAIIDEAIHSERLSSDALVRVTSDIWLVQDTFTQAMTSGYREEMTNQILAHEQERSALVEALLDGRITDSTTLWEIAESLRINPHGSHVVVAAEVPDIGHEALPKMENTLRAKDIASAWRLLPSVQVGIVCLLQPDQIDRLVAALERVAAGRVGISPVANVAARWSPRTSRRTWSFMDRSIARCGSSGRARSRVPERTICSSGSAPHQFHCSAGWTT